MRSLPLLAAVALALPSAARADDLPPPEIRWSRGPAVLTVKIVPDGTTHLADDLPLQLTLDDGGYFVVRWTESRVPADGPMTVKLPSVAGDESEGWTLTLSGGVCNDDGSVCLPYHAEATLPRRGERRGKLVAQAGRPPAPERPTRADVPPRTADPHMLPEGARWFSATDEGGVDAAFSMSAETGKNVLIDFYADWCPPCDRLRDEFLEQRAQLGLLGRFVLLKADADHPASFDLKDRYKVGGYPTMLVVTPDGTELERFLGYDGRLAELTARLEAAAAGNPANGDVRSLVAAGQTAEAWALFNQRLDEDPELAKSYDFIRLGLRLGREVAEPADLAHLHRQAAFACRLPGLEVHHAAQAADILEEAGDAETASAIRAEAEGRITAAIAERSPADVVLGRGWTSINGLLTAHEPDLHDDIALGGWYRAAWLDEDGARQVLADGALRMALAILTDEAAFAPELPVAEDGRVSVALPDHLLTDTMKPRLMRQEGRVHDLLDLLSRAGLPDVAEPILQAMLELAPDEFTWHYRYAGFLRKHRASEGAVAAARAALEHSYGDNRLRASMRLAELLNEAGEPDEAIAVLDEALTAAVPTQEHVRTHRYRTKVEELRAEIAGAGDEADEEKGAD